MQPIVAAPRRKTTKNTKAQLYFGFFEPRGAVTIPAKSVVKKVKQARVTQSSTKNQEEFRDLCLMLHGLAQKHVSRADFEDFTALVRCTKLLVDLGLPITPSSALAAPVAHQDAALVLCDPKYRLLRNRAIACLATVADLVTKAPPKGSFEYQQGIRDAFQQASDIAVLFLEDIQNGV